MERYVLRFKKGSGPTAEPISILRHLTERSVTTVRRNYFRDSLSIGLVSLPDGLTGGMADIIAAGIQSRLENGHASLHKIVTGDVAFQDRTDTDYKNHAGSYNVYVAQGSFPVPVAYLSVFSVEEHDGHYGTNIYKWTMLRKNSDISSLDGEFETAFSHPFADDIFGLVRSGIKTDFFLPEYSP